MKTLSKEEELLLNQDSIFFLTGKCIRKYITVLWHKTKISWSKSENDKTYVDFVSGHQYGSH